MTEKEKAASYHPDWKPGVECKPDQEAGEVNFGWSPDWNLSELPRRVPYCTMHKLPLEHLIPPPDMVLPQNYMLAIKALVEKYGAIQLTLTRGAMNIASPGFAIEGLGNTPTEALAAFYDAEKENEEDGNR